MSSIDGIKLSREAVNVQTSCCDDDCPVKNEIDPVNPQPCSKHCACYLSRAVADLKTNITTQLAALSELSQYPSYRLNLTESELQLFPPNESSSSDSTLFLGIVARELTSRRRDLRSMTELQARLQKPTSDLSQMLETKAILKSAAVDGVDGDGYDAELEKKTRAEMLERSRERRRRMSETFDPTKDVPVTGESRDSLSRERELDREALKSALRALARLLRDEGCRRDASTLARLDDEASGSCEHGDEEGECFCGRAAELTDCSY